jgi:hypothetical protein
MRLMTDGTEPSPGSRRSEAVTDDYGRYVLTDVSVGRVFVLWVGHPELGIRTLDVPPLQPGEDRTVNVALERVASIRGEIPADLLGEGRGVVELMTRDGRGLASDRRAKIDPENREYVFRPVRSGEKLLAFTVRNGTRFYAGFQEVTVAEGAHVDLGPWRPLDSTLKLRLKPVLDGLESREADLMFDASEGEPRRYVNLMHVRVPIGVDFTVQGMRAGKLQLTAVPFDAEATLPSTRFGYAKDEFEFDGTYAARELVLEPAGGVGPKGIMKFRAAPPPGVQADAVSFRWILWSGRDALERLTRDYKGILAFTSGLRAPGRYRVEVYGGGFVATAEYEQGDGDKDMRIPESAWTPAQTLAGVVRDAGEPAAGALVALLVKNESGELVDVAETKAASDGTFEFRAMPQTSELLVHAVLGGKSSRRTPVSGLRSSRDVVLEVQ